MVTVCPAWLKPTWMRWRATWMPPRLDTRRWMVRPGCGSGSGPARRTPWSLCRWPGGMGQGRVRHRMPSWVMTCMTWPSRRIVARCPASGEPTWMTWLPRVMIPAELTSRWTSTQLVAAKALGACPAGGGPAGRAPLRRSRAWSTADSRGRDGLDLPPGDAQVHGGGVDPEPDRLPGSAGAQPKLLRPDGHVARRRDHAVDKARQNPRAVARRTTVARTQNPE
jgi:hypothetical protein